MDDYVWDLETDQLMKWKDLVKRLRQERDEARQVARACWEMALSLKSVPELLEMLDKHPWLKADG